MMLGTVAAHDRMVWIILRVAHLRIQDLDLFELNMLSGRDLMILGHDLLGVNHYAGYVCLRYPVATCWSQL